MLSSVKRIGEGATSNLKRSSVVRPRSRAILNVFSTIFISFTDFLIVFYGLFLFDIIVFRLVQ